MAGLRKITQFADSLLNRITNVTLGISGMMILVMAFVSTYGALKRYLLHSPDAYAYISVTMLMLGCAMFSLAGVQSLRRHITVDFLTGYVPKIGQDIIKNIIAPSFGIVLVIVFIQHTWKEAMFALQTSQHTISAALIPTFPFKIMIPFMLGLLGLVLLVQMLDYIFSLTQRE